MIFLRLPRFRHLKNRLLFQNSLSISLIIGLTAVITYAIAIEIQIKDAIRYNTVMVTQISKSIDNMVESYNRVVDEISFHDEVQNLLLSKYENETQRNLINKSLSSHVVDETMMFDEVDLIYLYDMENVRVKIRRSVNNNQYEYFDTLRPRTFDKSGKVKWKVQNSIITANRMIYGLNSYYLEPIGFITMSMEKSYLQERIQKFDPAEDRHIIILDSENNVVLSNSQDEELSTVTSRLSNVGKNPVELDSIVDIPNYGKMVVSNYQSELTGWKIISLISLNEISEGPALIGKTVFIIGIVAIIIGIFFIWISTNYIVKPLNQLSVVMDEVEKDNFNVQVQIDRVDELGRVGESFNRMMNKINTLISDIYQKDINEKDAQLRALRAQINPHFLYNTLDTINWMAQFGKSDDVSKMTVSLSNLLKTSIKNNREFIRLEEEIKYINDYMTIQKIRFQDKFQYSINCDPDAKDCLVPKLILQPIVENAMIHGIEKKIDKGYLFINANIKGTKLHIQVIDNGPGMDENTFSALSEGSYIHQEHKQGTGNGISNVRNRISLLYGEDNGIEIQSNINVGTLFELIIPVHREG
jgi:two-component system, sensor histidine kinase YesM